jgi:hypothetical protein
VAASQLSNSARLNQLPLQPTFQSPRIDAGVVIMRHSPDHIGWRLVASAVRRYRALSPEGRDLVRAFMVALALSAILIRLIVIFEG